MLRDALRKHPLGENRHGQDVKKTPTRWSDFFLKAANARYDVYVCVYYR